MKIRSGFVSNSSSSSFIVGAPGEDVTTAAVAEAMLMVIAEDYGDHENNDAALKWARAHPKFDSPILIPWTCNYETYIWKNANGVCIDTCHNHDWSTLHDGEDAYDYTHLPEDYKYERMTGPGGAAYDEGAENFLHLGNFELYDLDGCDFWEECRMEEDDEN